MNPLPSYLTICLLLVSAIGHLGSAGAEPKPKPDREELEALIEQLGDDEFVRRETAKSRLTKLGESAYEVLGRHRKHPDPEVRARVRSLLRSLEGLPRIDPKLEKSYKSGIGGTGVTLSFENRSKNPIRIYWINTSGERQAWRGLLKPGEKALCDRTFSSHVWLITDADSIGLGLYVVGKKQARIIVRGSE